MREVSVEGIGQGTWPPNFCADQGSVVLTGLDDATVLLLALRNAAFTDAGYVIWVEHELCGDTVVVAEDRGWLELVWGQGGVDIGTCDSLSVSQILCDWMWESSPGFAPTYGLA